MTTAELTRHLQTHGRYETPASHRPRGLARLAGRWDGRFYLGFLFVVIRATRLARRGLYTRQEWGDDACRTMWLAERCGGVVTFEGYGNIASYGGALVYAANHQSMLETLILPSFLLGLRDLATVVKSSLTTYPLFGPVMRACHPIAVDRVNPRDDLKRVLEQGEQMLRGGRSVLLFPQATRSRTFRPSEFNSLGVKLARNASVPIVPVAVKTDFMGIGRFVRDLGPLNRAEPIRFRAGAPIPVGRDNSREVHEACLQFVSGALREWGIPVREEDPTA